MRRMDKVLDVNLQDGYVTVEAGTTWETVYTTLKEQGVRTPYYGPLSGRYATVGGALSQNSVFWGAGRAGTVADSVLTLEVVTGEGKIVRTGTAGRPGSTPFNRYFGPDLTGMFIGDTGAMGIKAIATLRTLPFPEHTIHHSIAVPDFAAAIRAMEAIGRFGIATEVYNLDPFYADAMVKAGIELLREHPWTVHLSVDGATEAIAEAGMAKLRDVASGFGETIDPVVPAVFRSDPFGSVQAVLLGPEGQIWLPIHAFLPFSRAEEAATAVKDFERRHAEEFERHGIQMSYLTVCSGNDFLFEPSFYWFDELGTFRLERIAEEAGRDWRSIPADTDARSAVLRLRRELAGVFDDLGAVHIQIAKYYDYAPRIEENSRELVRAFKRAVDPRGLMNPGALGI
jgi:D-lactate dehydrogenase (cytochrome)